MTGTSAYENHLWTANPRDLTAFKTSLEMLPPVRYLLEEMQSDLLKEIHEDLDSLEDLCYSSQERDPGGTAYCHERRKHYPGRL